MRNTPFVSRVSRVSRCTRRVRRSLVAILLSMLLSGIALPSAASAQTLDLPHVAGPTDGVGDSPLVP